ncbi:hypothetical protein NONO_c17630 [Nocardia nova SH22a]|uniref:Uncharacterized protein n=1 Tax=Nocardia nova SH22a TaxID=1415166 RepID=W5TC64_9NOCA|nr:hypothetical protein [Nocardia nova]AHH16563.1 hypothetical protein NONO_c17630 [Nocardia nova SH22a]
MTRTWVSDTDRRWVMKCDQSGCATRSEEFPREPPLAEFQNRGWFIAKLWGDICPDCLARGVRPTAKVEPYRGITPAVMAALAAPRDRP